MEEGTRPPFRGLGYCKKLVTLDLWGTDRAGREAGSKPRTLQGNLSDENANVLPEINGTLNTEDSPGGEERGREIINT